MTNKKTHTENLNTTANYCKLLNWQKNIFFYLQIFRILQLLFFLSQLSTILQTDLTFLFSVLIFVWYVKRLNFKTSIQDQTLTLYCTKNLWQFWNLQIKSFWMPSPWTRIQNTNMRRRKVIYIFLSEVFLRKWHMYLTWKIHLKNSVINFKDYIHYLCFIFSC